MATDSSHSTVVRPNTPGSTAWCSSREEEQQNTEAPSTWGPGTWDKVGWAE